MGQTRHPAGHHLLAARRRRFLPGPIALLVEGPPPAVLTLPNVVGYLHLGIIGTGLDYSLWFRGVHLLPASTTAMLGLLSPLVATLAGWALLGHRRAL